MPRDAQPFDWDRLLATVQSDHPDLYRAWFASLPPAEPARGELCVRVDDPAQAHYLREQCREAFTSAMMKLSGRLASVRFVSPQDEDLIAAHDSVLPAQPFSVDHTFEEFVVGPNNRLAHAACRAVSQQPGTLYNPLFLHGASGLGKTHLLQATCQACLRGNALRRIVYVTCETFVNEFVRAIATGQLQQFRQRARETDLLVIDDVQFLANRESSQEELFHTFNALYQSRKQLILSADSPPSEIPTLEDRLVSRFNWGLVAQIDLPNRETRQAILQRKAQLRGADVPADVIDFIAERVETDIRTLEGALTSVIFEVQNNGKPMNLDTAREVLASYQGRREARSLQISDILEIVSMHYGIRLQELLGRRRPRSIAHPRQVAMYLARRLTPLSLEEIGAHFGGRDHSTVLHAERSIEAERTSDTQMAETLTLLTRRLLARM